MGEAIREMGKKGANGKPKYTQRQKQSIASKLGSGISKKIKGGFKISSTSASALRKDKQFEVCFDDDEGYQQQAATKEDPHSAPTAESGLTMLLHTPSSAPREAGVYTEQQRILLVGEGDFSFAMALASRRGSRNLVATSFDSLHEVKMKYPTAHSTITTLRTAGVQIHGSIDATKLGDHLPVVAPEGKKLLWDRIAFNFPHVGGSSDEDIENNQALLTAFFEQCRPLLHPSRGWAVVTLRDTSFYRSWNINKLAQEAGLSLHDTRRFDTDVFATYTPVRTNPAVREAPTADGAISYAFGCHRKRSKKSVSKKKKGREQEEDSE